MYVMEYPRSVIFCAIEATGFPTASSRVSPTASDGLMIVSFTSADTPCFVPASGCWEVTTESLIGEVLSPSESTVFRFVKPASFKAWEADEYDSPVTSGTGVGNKIEVQNQNTNSTAAVIPNAQRKQPHPFFSFVIRVAFPSQTSSRKKASLSRTRWILHSNVCDCIKSTYQS